mmetsp:Transcript_11957/g.35944  ORF Transcript_11957/g.35944 Transcript_11957/m.35944 type:complete len:831 (+) Transcript_11957:68-2560(+)
MGQSHGKVVGREVQAGLCASLDADLQGDWDEEALGWTHKGMEAVMRKPLAMVRASVVDLAATEREPAVDSLLKVLRGKTQTSPHVVGTAECEGFVERLLPGVVEADGWDGCPVNGYFHDKIPDNGRRFVELARKHPGDEPASRKGTRGTSAEGFDADKYAPLTTKAGSRIWSVYWASEGGSVAAVHAAYPCQILLRYDAARHRLCYDVADFKPITKVAFRRAFDLAVASDQPDAVATAAELKAVDALVRKSEKTRQDLHRMATGFAESLDEDDLSSSEVQEEEDPHFLRASPRDASSLEKLQHYGADALWTLLHHVRWKASWVRRVRVDLHAVVDAKVYALDALRHPNGDVFEPRDNKHGLTVQDLGTPSREPLNDDDEEDRRVATGLIAKDHTLETPAVLILQFSDPAPSFAATQVWPPSVQKRARVACEDWTPGQIASRSTRHYVVGDSSELQELTDFLAAKDGRFHTCVENVSQEEGHDDWNPSNVPAVEERALVAGLPADVCSRIGAFAAKKKVKKSDVNAFFAKAGVENPVNRCLKAAMLSGKLDSWLRFQDNPSAFLDSTLLEGKCPCCGVEEISVSIREVLTQPEVGHDYDDGAEMGAAYCDECETGLYVTGVCCGDARFDTGKGANHCVFCPDWGQCIGDVRNSHCGRCGNHYFSGTAGFRCPCKGGLSAGNFFDGYLSDDFMDDDDDDSDSLTEDGDDDAPDEAPSQHAGASSPPPPNPESWNATLECVPEIERAELLEEAEDLLGPGAVLTKMKALFEALRGRGFPLSFEIPDLADLRALDGVAALRGKVTTLRDATRATKEVTAQLAGEGTASVADALS